MIYAIKTLLAGLLTLALFTAGYAQTLDKVKLDRFFDRLVEKNKAMGVLIVARDNNVLYIQIIGYSQINRADKETFAASVDLKNVHRRDYLSAH